MDICLNIGEFLEWEGEDGVARQGFLIGNTEDALLAISEGQQYELDLTEAEYRTVAPRVGQAVHQRGTNKYFVYVRSPETGRVMRVTFGDPTIRHAAPTMGYHPHLARRKALRHRARFWNRRRW